MLLKSSHWHCYKPVTGAVISQVTGVEISQVTDAVTS